MRGVVDGDRGGSAAGGAGRAYLAWLSRIERAPTTVGAYAHDLKTYWSFLSGQGIAWDAVMLEQLGAFTTWLRQPADNVVVLATPVG